MNAAVVWVDASSKLPDDDMTVLIADTENDVTLGFHDGDHGWRYCSAEKVGDPVTHWAELPKPPNVKVHTPLPASASDETEVKP